MGADVLRFEGGPLDGLALPHADEGGWPPPVSLDPTALAIRHRLDVRVPGKYLRTSWPNVPRDNRPAVSRVAVYEWEPT
jgi:hypothetical protein